MIGTKDDWIFKVWLILLWGTAFGHGFIFKCSFSQTGETLPIFISEIFSSFKWLYLQPDLLLTCCQVATYLSSCFSFVSLTFMVFCCPAPIFLIYCFHKIQNDLYYSHKTVQYLNIWYVYCVLLQINWVYKTCIQFFYIYNFLLELVFF